MKKILLGVAFVSIVITASSQNFWSISKDQALEKTAFKNRPKPDAFTLLQLNEAQLLTALSRVPNEKQVSANKSAIRISIPVSADVTETFTVVEAPVMDPQLAARYPGIKSYAGSSVEHPGNRIRFSMSMLGFSGMILSLDQPTVYIDPIDEKNGTYLMVSRKDIVNYKSAFTCLTDFSKNTGIENIAGGAPNSGSISAPNADDGNLRTYRLALCAAAEFSAYWLNGTETSDAQRKAKVLAAQNNQMTRANGIFERDFSLRLVLVANNDAVIYLDAANDPFTTSGSWNSQTQTTCDNVIGSANYDIGHLVQRASNNGNAGCIGCVCKASNKGSAFTSYQDLSSDFFVVDYLTHEMGHQLGGNHTFTFRNESTIAQVEPGSGSTIMGYAGITGSTTDVQPHSDDYFHAISIQQITNYAKTTTCANVVATGNGIPTANAGADYSIPRSTPFKLTGTGSDPDAGDVVSFVWEQNNASAGRGSSTVPSATAAAGPQFRSFLPTTTSTSRTIPALASILDGTNNNKWEVLPSVARTLNFRFTVKDNRANGGANFSDDMVLTVVGTAGPFTVTSPNTAVAVAPAGTTTVSWSVNSTNLAPINCASVNILLSTDGGLTFPTVLATATPNDGSEVVSIPDVASTTARIKVEAVGNIFFDISNTNFTIGTPPPCAAPAGLSASAITGNSATASWGAVSGAVNYSVSYKTSASSTWTNDVNTTSTSLNLTGLVASTLYDWRVKTNCSSSASNYTTAQFTTAVGASPCPGALDVSTNGTTGGAATIALNTDIRGTISPVGDNDYYKFVITTGGTITLSLTTLPANYELALLNDAGSTLLSSTNTGTINESITTPVDAGTYFARVYPQKNNQSSATNCYTLRVQTGTASKSTDTEELITSNFNVSPNPANGFINLVFKEVSLINQQGAVIQSTNIASAAGRNQSRLDVSKIGSGVYFVKIVTSKGTKMSKVIISR